MYIFLMIFLCNVRPCPQQHFRHKSIFVVRIYRQLFIFGFHNKYQLSLQIHLEVFTKKLLNLKFNQSEQNGGKKVLTSDICVVRFFINQYGCYFFKKSHTYEAIGSFWPKICDKQAIVTPNCVFCAARATRNPLF